jgi:DNA adenine methylase
LRSFLETSVKVKALAPWYGSKRTLAPRIVAELGKHKAYWEPFCGSMAVLLLKPACKMETVSDLHGDLINLARVVRDSKAGPQLYRKLRRTMCCEQFQRESATALMTPIEFGEVPNVDRAYDFFIASWMGRSGLVGLNELRIAFGGVIYTNRVCSQGANLLQRATRSISAWRKRLRCVTILNRNGFDLLERIEDEHGTAIYCDPPYIEKVGGYVHDFEDKDHVALSELLDRFQHARVVLSYYDHPQLAELYPDWTRVTCDKATSLARYVKPERRNGDLAPEVLLINGPSYTSEYTLWPDEEVN